MAKSGLLYAGLAVVAIIAIWIYLGSGQQPSSEPMVEVQLPEFSVTEKRGEELFNQNCASCHGQNAAGQDGVAPPLIHKIYEPGHHADIAFQRAVEVGVRAHHWRFGNMPAVEGISKRDVGRIIAYIRKVQQANGIE